MFLEIYQISFLRHDLGVFQFEQIEVYGYGGTDVISLPLSYISNKVEQSDQIKADSLEDLTMMYLLFRKVIYQFVGLLKISIIA